MMQVSRTISHSSGLRLRKTSHSRLPSVHARRPNAQNATTFACSTLVAICCPRVADKAHASTRTRKIHNPMHTKSWLLNTVASSGNCSTAYKAINMMLPIRLAIGITGGQDQREIEHVPNTWLQIDIRRGTADKAQATICKGNLFRSSICVNIRKIGKAAASAEKDDSVFGETPMLIGHTSKPCVRYAPRSAGPNAAAVTNCRSSKTEVPEDTTIAAADVNTRLKALATKKRATARTDSHGTIQKRTRVTTTHGAAITTSTERCKFDDWICQRCCRATNDLVSNRWAWPTCFAALGNGLSNAIRALRICLGFAAASCFDLVRLPSAVAWIGLALSHSRRTAFSWTVRRRTLLRG